MTRTARRDEARGRAQREGSEIKAKRQHHSAQHETRSHRFVGARVITSVCSPAICHAMPPRPVRLHCMSRATPPLRAPLLSLFLAACRLSTRAVAPPSWWAARSSSSAVCGTSCRVASRRPHLLQLCAPRSDRAATCLGRCLSDWSRRRGNRICKGCHGCYKHIRTMSVVSIDGVSIRRARRVAPRASCSCILSAPVDSAPMLDSLAPSMAIIAASSTAAEPAAAEATDDEFAPAAAAVAAAAEAAESEPYSRMMSVDTYLAVPRYQSKQSQLPPLLVGTLLLHAREAVSHRPSSASRPARRDGARTCATPTHHRQLVCAILA